MSGEYFCKKLLQFKFHFFLRANFQETNIFEGDAQKVNKNHLQKIACLTKRFTFALHWFLIRFCLIDEKGMP